MRTSLANGWVWAVFLGVLGCGARSLDSGEGRAGVSPNPEGETLGETEGDTEIEGGYEPTDGSGPEQTFTGTGGASPGVMHGAGGTGTSAGPGAAAGAPTQPIEEECVLYPSMVNDAQRMQRMAKLFWGDANADTTDYAAASGDFEQIASEMLDDPRATAGVARFVRHWFGLGGELQLAVTEAEVPELSQLTDSLLQSTDQTIVYLFQQEAPLRSLFTSNSAMVDSQLGEYYGVEAPVVGFEWVTLSEERSAGLLSQAHWLAASPNLVRRGTSLRVNLLCSPIPSPPVGVEVALPESANGLTSRERFAEHQSQPACAGCHSLIDPLGYAFENFDSMGRYRTTDAGKPVDASGELPDMGGLPFSDHRELVGLLEGPLHEQVSSCALKTALDYASMETESLALGSGLSEACVSRYAVELEMAAAQFIRHWLVALATHPVFDDDSER